ncbi:hypothetical protein LTS16_003415 [Friedmanniomyces endolithicus]|uniref:F-box domain-containing protein n=1 Tax=Friedmanniomyces endolithicus TaxID=329885 RepID=A0AAN6JDN7_9PEZI|nr:hypothetical protein LTR35_013503 [Friedmanniomyces endolithicus]KAK0280589.1 hypothetical protein LTS00_013018 [Friedmanniomyces endolithicus]KAK0320570.1 hypothetical protein LTR82_008283 [Friedmanniomyces endolithicus]KAK1012649.1 hypothetical protein LTR54_004576 [Friedmanniomyces endolithicus]KAK1049959.1 hypothetical protein LTS16_003415 [Friedmanniomyces endolithicus]
MPHTLLTLPPELRNQVYSYVLPTETQEIRFSTSVFPPVPALLQVSQQTREETSGLYYQHCAFDLVLHHRSLWQFRVWIVTLSPSAVWGLGHNGNLNLRVVFDEQHKEYERFRHMLKFYIHGSCSRSGWFVSAEDTQPRALGQMAGVHINRKNHGRSRAEDEGLALRRRGTHYAMYRARRKEGRDAMRTALRAIYDRVSQSLWARCELLRTAK